MTDWNHIAKQIESTLKGKKAHYVEWIGVGGPFPWKSCDRHGVVVKSVKAHGDGIIINDSDGVLSAYESESSVATIRPGYVKIARKNRADEVITCEFTVE